MMQKSPIQGSIHSKGKDPIFQIPSDWEEVPVNKALWPCSEMFCDVDYIFKRINRSIFPHISNNWTLGIINAK